MLEMRPGCECCDKDLPADSEDAMICSFECTFCRDCVEQRLQGVCPNCGGPFTVRPPRSNALQEKYPPAIQRVFNPQGCTDKTATA